MLAKPILFWGMLPLAGYSFEIGYRLVGLMQVPIWIAKMATATVRLVISFS